MTVGLLVAKHAEKLGERIKHDHYPTPHEPLEAIASRWHWKRATSILDIGAGDGRFGLAFAKHCSQSPYLVGIEIREDEPPNPEFDHWYRLDYCQPMFNQVVIDKFDLIVGNPPFNKAQKIIETAWHQHLNDTGRIKMLLPDSFVYGIERNRTILTYLPPFRVVHLTPRIDFTKSGNPYKEMLLAEWRKDEPLTPNQWRSVSWNWQAALGGGE